MENLKHIKVFKFDYAQYVIEDELGNPGLLQIDYKNRAYKVQKLTKELDATSVNEISYFAEELLDRKYNVNFAAIDSIKLNKQSI